MHAVGNCKKYFQLGLNTHHHFTTVLTLRHGGPGTHRTSTISNLVVQYMVTTGGEHLGVLK